MFFGWGVAGSPFGEPVAAFGIILADRVSLLGGKSGIMSMAYWVRRRGGGKGFSAGKTVRKMRTNEL